MNSSPYDALLYLNASFARDSGIFAVDLAIANDILPTISGILFFGQIFRFLVGLFKAQPIFFQHMYIFSPHRITIAQDVLLRGNLLVENVTVTKEG